MVTAGKHACASVLRLARTGMSAFGRKNGVGGMSAGARPSFGVAKPMKGGCRAPRDRAPAPGGDQFPPLPGDMDAMAPAAARAARPTAATR